MRNYPQISINERSEEPVFNEIIAKPLPNFNNFNTFHSESARNNIMKYKKSLISKNIPNEIKENVTKKKRSISTRIIKEKTNEIDLGGNPLNEMKKIRDILKVDKMETNKMRKFLKRKQRAFSLNLKKLDKEMKEIF